jgi:hypothetical protein
MYLILPESMILPEVDERREDKDFEDWLTAALIENTTILLYHSNKRAPPLFSTFFRKLRWRVTLRSCYGHCQDGFFYASNG